MSRVVDRGRLIWLVVAMLALASCAPTLLGRAKQSASASYSVYEAVTPQVANQIEEIVQKSRTRTITASDRKRLRSLNELKKILDDYAKAHNLFVEGVKTWEQTGREPDNVVLLESQVLQLINRAVDLAAALDIELPAGLR